MELVHQSIMTELAVLQVHGIGARGLRLKLQQKQALIGSLDSISVFALDVPQIDFLLWSLVGNISKRSVKQRGVKRKRGEYKVSNVPTN